jgi:DNA-binding NarL/FixJ family response regulator
MGSSFVGVLVVDDFKQWRQFACATLQDIPDVAVVGEASDGPEAIEKAAKLRPDLVLLDIGLPSLNGVEVARQIQKLCPDCSIIFLTENQSNEVIEECFRTGASEYVVKSSAAIALALAIKAALKVLSRKKNL